MIVSAERWVSWFSPYQRMLQVSRYTLLAIWPVLTHTLYVMLTRYMVKHGLRSAVSLT